MARPHSIPQALLHRASGQAVVRLSGRDHYLRAFGSAEPRARYEHLIAKWLANGRQLPDAELTLRTVNEIILAYLRHAAAHYRPNSRGINSELDCIKFAVKVLRTKFGRTPVVEFGPKALKNVRTEMLERGWCRDYVNHQIYRLRRITVSAERQRGWRTACDARIGRL